jgi:hypothetical protein
VPNYTGEIVGVLLWCAFWLAAVNWKRAWTVLGEGGWAPVVLLLLVGALVWSRIAFGVYYVWDMFVIPNFWAHLLAGSGLVALALFCGWLQGVLGWTPAEINLEPHAAHHHGHDHHHQHGHHHGHH